LSAGKTRVQLDSPAADSQGMPAMTTELLRLIGRERAWGRLEQAVDRVEQAEAQLREMTRELDEWRAERPQPEPR
jgi:hypothetical protein